eukprot:scaffold4705_cov108-Cylindrotheca_fusiformis.AAC.8
MDPSPIRAIQLQHSALQREHDRLFLLLSEQQQRYGKLDQKNHCRPHRAMRNAMRLRKKRNKVGFASHVLVHFRPCKPENTAGTWYSKMELAEFRKGRKAAVAALHQAKGRPNAVDSSKHSLRGLEPYFSASIFVATQKKREAVVNRVLAEQKRVFPGTPDPEVIRNISRAESEWARDNALEIAKQDAKSVERHLIAE